MPNTDKLEKVAALKGRIEGSNALLLAEFRGLSVHDATELRRSLAETARFSVVKNSLMKHAADQAGIQELEAILTGSTAVAFVEGDVVTAAKKVADAAKRFPALVLKGAYMEGKVLGAAEAQGLASLDSREVMLSKIAGMMKSEMSRAAGMFQALQSRFVGLLEAYKAQFPAEEVPADVVEAPSAEAAGTGEEVPDAEPETQAETQEETEPKAAEAGSAEIETAAEADAEPSPEQSEPSTGAADDGSSGADAGAEDATEPITEGEE